MLNKRPTKHLWSEQCPDGNMWSGNDPTDCQECTAAIKIVTYNIVKICEPRPWAELIWGRIARPIFSKQPLCLSIRLSYLIPFVLLFPIVPFLCAFSIQYSLLYTFGALFIILLYSVYYLSTYSLSNNNKIFLFVSSCSYCWWCIVVFYLFIINVIFGVFGK